MRIALFLPLFLLLPYCITVNAQQLSHNQIKDSIEVILDASNTPNAFITVVNKQGDLFSFRKKIKNSDNLFALGSISKTFTALGIMKLVDEGKISLETELRQIAPEIDFKNKWEESHPIKIKHLLTHRSGFYDIQISDLIKKRDSEMNAYDEVKSFNKSYVSNWKPGLVHSYSNPGYVILGYLIEKISGTSYQNYITKKIIHPLSMNNTSYLTQLPKNIKVKGFNGKTENAENPRIIGESAGGLVSSENDMSKFLQYFLNEEIQDSLNIISPSLVSEMLQLQSEFEIINGIKFGYGPGMYNREFGSNKINFKGHNGSIDGFNSDYIFNTDLDIGIAISRNQFYSSNRRILNLLVDQFIDTDSIKNIEPTNVLPSNLDIEEWEGSYKLLNGSNQLVHFINSPARILKLEKKGSDIIIKRFLGGREQYKRTGINRYKEFTEDQNSLYLSSFDGEKVLSLYGDTLVKTNPIIHYSNFTMVILGLVSGIILSILLIIQLVAVFFRKTIKPYLQSSLFILIPFWLIIISVIIYLSNSGYSDLEALGNLSFTSVSLFLCTLIYPFVLISGGWLFLKKVPDFKNTFSKIFYLVTFLTISYLNIYCLSHGWFALRLWS